MGIGGSVVSGTDVKACGSYDQKQHESCKDDLNTCNKMTKEFETIMETQKGEIDGLKYDVETLEDKLTNEETLRKEADEKLKDNEDDIANMRNAKENAEKELQAAKNTIAARDKTIKDANATINALTNSNKSCNTCNADKKVIEKERDNYKKDRDSYKSQRDTYKKRIDNTISWLNGKAATFIAKRNDIKKKLESFTPESHSGARWCYCAIAVIVGILIGAWIFSCAYHKRKRAATETVEVETVYVPDGK